MSNGFRVLKRSRAVSAEQVAAGREIPVANISDSINRLFAGGATLRPMHGGDGGPGPDRQVSPRR